jgi:putative hydrolase of the HAD superfamily
MIRVVAFDIGKVLLDFDYGIFVKRMAPRTNLGESGLNSFLNQSPLLAKYESGQLTSSEFAEVVRQETGFGGLENEFAAFFEEIFTPIPDVIKMHRKIAESGMATYTFSNTNEMAVRHMSREYDFWPRFSGHVLSHEVKALKPEAKMYEFLERVADCRGDEIVYVDDRPENVQAGRARGWKAIEHRTPKETRLALAEFGVMTAS